MNQSFGARITSTTSRRIWAADVMPNTEEIRIAAGTRRPAPPVLWNILIEGKDDTDDVVAYSGAQIEIRWNVGDGQQRRAYTLGGTARRWRGMATSVEVWAALRDSTETIVVSGTGGWDAVHHAGGGASPVLGTHQVAAITLSYDQATTDSAISDVGTLGACHEEARRFSITAGPLTSGSAMVPVTVTLYGQRFIGNIWVPLGSMVVTSGFGGGNMLVVDVIPGQFDNLGYNVTGFPTTNGGQSTLHAWEELDSEGC